jgi:hypothetical protein
MHPPDGFMAFSKMGFGVGKSRAFDFEKAMLTGSIRFDQTLPIGYNISSSTSNSPIFGEVTEQIFNFAEGGSKSIV